MSPEIINNLGDKFNTLIISLFFDYRNNQLDIKF